MNKKSVALHQLDKAIKLYIDEQDFICAITLSGAAEEILGRLVVMDGNPNASEELVKRLHYLSNEQISEKIIRNEHTNFARNSMKHFNKISEFDFEVDFDPKPHATQLIARCCSNIVKLELPLSEQVNRFISYSFGRI
ncbi:MULTISPECIES: hypothetical protein [Aliivibrio]|uniref:Uncharacterized protein n=1 Tax=Aliivibrio finisterrensis TaxID=511998 RepID=A0A4Q5KJ56_9GAMM|nr:MULTISPECIES: hypothetical protein [Aliivibrio]MDD9180748.1 hypothetical protein [Aliivibrio sp. A6]RYU46284.1 hypothetical protein ERW57_19275 [Aliivibrio finisterrensis]RYU46802.1 hypothetical protein ERW56_19520 [Aliivibrio finisterrensis]RYU52227.1 hypothetical protein ERW50_19310 [Aliivibrio finisterrensis]RYU58520.1 hypothetical protein ERW53_20490 [Aliivibrio finisterrensis]